MSPCSRRRGRPPRRRSSLLGGVAGALPLAALRLLRALLSAAHAGLADALAAGPALEVAPDPARQLGVQEGVAARLLQRAAELGALRARGHRVEELDGALVLEDLAAHVVAIEIGAARA